MCIRDSFKAFLVVSSIFSCLLGVVLFLVLKTQLWLMLLCGGVLTNFLNHYTLWCGSAQGKIPLVTISIFLKRKPTFLGLIRLLFLDYPIAQHSQRPYRLWLLYHCGFQQTTLKQKLLAVLFNVLCFSAGCPPIWAILLHFYLTSLLRGQLCTLEHLMAKVEQFTASQSWAESLAFYRGFVYYPAPSLMSIIKCLNTYNTDWSIRP